MLYFFIGVGIGFIVGIILQKLIMKLVLTRGEILLISENYFTAELTDESQLEKLGKHKRAVFSVRKKNKSYNGN